MTAYSLTLKNVLDDDTFAFKIDFDLNDPHQKIIFDCYNEGRCYEPDITAVMLRAIKPGDFVIDVGANIGVFTLLMAKLVGPEGKVLAFEPDPDNFAALRRNIELNGLENVDASQVPVWCGAEEVPFYKCLDNGGGHAIWDSGLYIGNELTRAEALPPAKVLATTLEQEIATVGRRCSFIKIDTEGTDEKILEGLGAHRPDFIIAESNPFGASQFGCSNDTMRKLMAGYGYDCFLITNDDDSLPAMVPDNTILTNGFNGYCCMNLLFSTLHNVGRAYPEAPVIKIPVEEFKR